MIKLFSFKDNPNTKKRIKPGTFCYWGFERETKIKNGIIMVLGNDNNIYASPEKQCYKILLTDHTAIKNRKGKRIAEASYYSLFPIDFGI